MKLCVIIDCPDDTPRQLVDLTVELAAARVNGSVRSAYIVTTPPNLNLVEKVLQFCGHNFDVITEVTP